MHAQLAPSKTDKEVPRRSPCASPLTWHHTALWHCLGVVCVWCVSCKRLQRESSLNSLTHRFWSTSARQTPLPSFLLPPPAHILGCLDLAVIGTPGNLFSNTYALSIGTTEAKVAERSQEGTIFPFSPSLFSNFSAQTWDVGC